MTRRTGTPISRSHGSHVPKWLAHRTTRLGPVIAEAIVHHYGRDELLRRLAHPFWFQSFGVAMGMDWHSSGIATSVIGALKRGSKINGLVLKECPCCSLCSNLPEHAVAS